MYHLGRRSSGKPVQNSSDIAIRLLTPDDLAGALALSTTAGWNQRAEDWRMLLQIAQGGSFAALAGERIVGTAIGIDYADFSWIAMMLVEPALRGRGLGRRLLEAAMAAVPGDTPIRLDATPLGRPLYQAYGFEDECTLTRCVAEGASRGRPPVHGFNEGAIEPRRVTEEDLPVLAQEDRSVFGGDRHAVLRWVWDIAPEYAHAVQDEGGRMQYCLGRRGRLFDQIGPVISGSDGAARALVGAALREAQGAVVMDVFDARAGFMAWLQSCGFTPQRPLFRMRRPPRREGRTGGTPQPQVSAEFAILGPEFA